MLDDLQLTEDLHQDTDHIVIIVTLVLTPALLAPREVTSVSSVSTGVGRQLVRQLPSTIAVYQPSYCLEIYSLYSFPLIPKYNIKFLSFHSILFKVLSLAAR